MSFRVRRNFEPRELVIQCSESQFRDALTPTLCCDAVMKAWNLTHRHLALISSMAAAIDPSLVPRYSEGFNVTHVIEILWHAYTERHPPLVVWYLRFVGILVDVAFEKLPLPTIQWVVFHGAEFFFPVSVRECFRYFCSVGDIATCRFLFATSETCLFPSGNDLCFEFEFDIKPSRSNTEVHRAYKWYLQCTGRTLGPADDQHYCDDPGFYACPPRLAHAAVAPFRIQRAALAVWQLCQPTRARRDACRCRFLKDA